MALSDPALSEWSLLKKLFFYFFFIFFLLYIILNPNEVIPYSYYLHKFYIQPCENLIIWLAKDVFHLVKPNVKFYNGTIDTVFGYLTVFFIFIFSVLGAFVWAFADRKKSNYYKSYHIMLIVLRYYLAISWIAYGSIKIIRLQFPPISPAMLLQTYGNSTPKELAWAFMGYANGYNYFIGFTEYAVGLLLFFRRTSLAGNILGIMILANVLAFNYTYGVNVKLLSTMLMAMSLFLLTKDMKRLINIFFLNKTVYPANDAPFYMDKKWGNKYFRIIKYVFIIYIIFFDLHGAIARAEQFGSYAIKPPLYGIYNVTEFIRNKDTLKPLTTDTNRWNKLIISAPKGNASVLLMNNNFKNFIINADTAYKKIVLFNKKGNLTKYVFSYSRPEKDMLLLVGKCNNDSLIIKLQQFPIEDFTLKKEKFRWIMDHNYPM